MNYISFDAKDINKQKVVQSRTCENVTTLMRNRCLLND